MENPLREWLPEPLTTETAFVVHLLAEADDAFPGLRGRVEHVRSGQSRRFVSTAELVTFMCQTLAEQSRLAANDAREGEMADERRAKRSRGAILVGSMLAVLLAGQAWAATDKACLTGNTSSVAADAQQIDALEGRIAAACPCASFDGSEGKERGDYRKCVLPLIKAAIADGQLRASCKSRLGKAFKMSSCGVIGVLPCIEHTGDKIRCRITTVEKCQSDGRSMRVACASDARCVDAGDHNGDYLVDSGDAADCVMPAVATATPTATATATVVPADSPTAVPTDSPTVTPTHTPIFTSTATPIPTEAGWTVCADEGGSCLLPGDRTVRFGANGVYVSLLVPAMSVPCTTAVFGDPLPGTLKHCQYYVAGSTPTATPTSEGPTPTPTVCPQSGGILPHVDVNLEDDPQSPPLPPDPQANFCFPQTLSGGGCKLNILEGSIDNVFDARASIDLARCPGDPAPSVLWEIFFPPIAGGALYTSAGITGHNGPLLMIRPNSLPSLATSSDPFWRVRVTLTSNVTGQTSQSWFRFEYETTCRLFSGCAS